MADKKEKQTNYNQLQKGLASKVSSSFSNAAANDLIKQLKSGENQYMKYERIVNTSYDNRWIDEIEKCIYDLGQIITNPKKVTKEVTDVVPVELARKTNAESITHLSTHSQFVKEVRENGDIIPNKILNIGTDDFYQTYENRFIATLIRKLVIFVEKRYQFLEQNSEIKKSQVLYVKNKSVVDGRDVEIETKVTISNNEISESIINTNTAFIKRVKELKRYLLYFYNSPFMAMMKTEKNVRNPILLTNIIRKNPYYNHCYGLYKFIEMYDAMGVDFKVSDKYCAFNSAELKEINELIATNFLALKPTETIASPVLDSMTFTPTIITTTDDEQMVYGPYFQGPLQYVRADEGYMKYLENAKRPTPVHPTKEEKTYYGSDILTNKEIKDEQEEIERFLARKEKSYKPTLKHFEEVIIERSKEELEFLAEQQRLQNLALFEQIENARKELVEEAIPNEEAKMGLIEESPFDSLQDNFTVDFVDKIAAAEDSIQYAYREIRHKALCYGLVAKISKKGETFRFKNAALLKITLLGKTLKVHFALNFNDYISSPIPVENDANKKAFEDTPVLFRVRSPLSVRRALSLIEDLGRKYQLEYTELPYDQIAPSQEEVDNTPEFIDDEQAAIMNAQMNEQAQEAEEVKNPFELLKNLEVIPFDVRLKRARKEVKLAYQALKDHLYMYGLESTLSKKGETYRHRSKTLLRISIVGKTLIVHYALDPKKYEDAGYTVKDNSEVSAYEKIPLAFKINSDSAIQKAKQLIDDVMAENDIQAINKPVVRRNLFGFIKKEKPIFKAPKKIVVNYDEVEAKEEQYIDRDAIKAELESDTKTTEVLDRFVEYNERSEEAVAEPTKQMSQTFKSLKEMAFIPYEKRLSRFDAAKAKAYKEIRNYILSYGVKPYITSKCETFRAHNKTYVRFAVVGKTLILHFALDPKKYIGSEIAVKDNSSKSAYTAYPTCFKVTSESSVSRALQLVDDVMTDNDTKKLSKEEYDKFIKEIAATSSIEELNANTSNEEVDEVETVEEETPIEEVTETVETPVIEEEPVQAKVDFAEDLVQDDAPENYAPEIEETKPSIEQVEEAEEEEEESTEPVKRQSTISPTFKSLKEMEFIPYSKRLERLDDERTKAYKDIKYRILSYGVKSYVSSKCEAFRAHNKTYVRFAVVGKTLVLHFALDPKKYAKSNMKIIDNSSKSAYVAYPTSLKVTNLASAKDALELVEDVMKDNKTTLLSKEEIVSIIAQEEAKGLSAITEEVEPIEEVETPVVEEVKVESEPEVNQPQDVSEPEPTIEVKEEPEVETPSVVTPSDESIEEEEDEEDEGKPQISKTFKALKEMEYIPYTKRLERLDAEREKAYEDIKKEIESYGVKSYISLKCEAFRAHNMTYVRCTVVGKTLVLHFALDPKNYAKSDIKVIDNSKKSAYVVYPTGFKVINAATAKQALKLVADVMKAHNTKKL